MAGNKIEVFTSPEFGQVRTLTINGEPYFVGKDVAEALGYTNTKKAIGDHVDEEDKVTFRYLRKQSSKRSISGKFC